MEQAPIDFFRRSLSTPLADNIILTTISSPSIRLAMNGVDIITCGYLVDTDFWDRVSKNIRADSETDQTGHTLSHSTNLDVPDFQELSSIA
jgi:hypothetical protein